MTPLSAGFSALLRVRGGSSYFPTGNKTAIECTATFVTLWVLVSSPLWGKQEADTSLFLTSRSIWCPIFQPQVSYLLMEFTPRRDHTSPKSNLSALHLPHSGKTNLSQDDLQSVPVFAPVLRPPPLLSPALTGFLLSGPGLQQRSQSFLTLAIVA